LFFPEGGEVNDFIETFCQVKYASLDKVLGMISALGKGAELYSTAHGQVFVNPIFILKLYSKMVKIRRVYY
jgi:hypothetical protein